MKISIITVCWNSEKTIEDTIQSVLAQDYKDLEYIIIDGASTDGTLEIINKYKDKIFQIVSEKDSGMYNALNKGFHLASGEVVGLLNADDVLADSSVISEVAKKFLETNADAIWGDLLYVDQKDTKKIIRNWESSEYKEGAFKNGWMPPHPCFYVKKEIYEKFGYLREDMKIAADYEVMLRLLERHKIKSAYIPKVLVRMRIGGMSNKNIGNIIRANKESYKAWELNGLKISPFRILLKPISKLIQYIK